MAIKSEQAVPGVMRWKSAIVGETVRQYRRIIHPDINGPTQPNHLEYSIEDMTHEAYQV